MTSCAQHPGTEATASCARCEAALCEACVERLDGRPYCTACVAALRERLAAAPAGAPAEPSSVPVSALPIGPPVSAVSPKAVAFAVAGGLAGALLWYGIVVVTDMKLGIVAIGVGWMVGQAGLRGNGGRGGAALGLTCVAIAILSMAAGEYFIVNHIVHRVLAERQPDKEFPAFLSTAQFVDVYGQTFGFMDAVFYAIGGWEAWRRPAAAK